MTMSETHGFTDRLDVHQQAVVQLSMSSPATGEVATFRVLIDTGANASGISRRVVDDLRLNDVETHSGLVNVRTVAGEVPADGFIVHFHPPKRGSQPGLQPQPGISALVSLLEMPASCDALIGTDVLRHMTRQVVFDFQTNEFKIVWAE